MESEENLGRTPPLTREGGSHAVKTLLTGFGNSMGYLKSMEHFLHERKPIALKREKLSKR